MLLYYITDRQQFPGTPAEQRRRLLDKITEAASAGVDYIQLRERDLQPRELEQLAKEAATAVRSTGSPTRLLINGRVDIALASQADGVHLRGDDIPASDARAIAAGRAGFVVGVSCHTVDQVRLAWSHGADFAVFAPVFEKNGKPGAGLSALRDACSVARNFVIALGGITLENARSCSKAGAVGVAGIRIFQTSRIGTLRKELESFGNRKPK